MVTNIMRLMRVYADVRSYLSGFSAIVRRINMDNAPYKYHITSHLVIHVFHSACIAIKEAPYDFLTVRDLLVYELRNSKAYACSSADLGKVLFYDVMFCPTKNRELLSEINCVSFCGISKELVEHLTYLFPFKCLLIKNL